MESTLAKEPSEPFDDQSHCHFPVLILFCLQWFMSQIAMFFLSNYFLSLSLGQYTFLVFVILHWHIFFPSSFLDAVSFLSSIVEIIYIIMVCWHLVCCVCVCGREGEYLSKSDGWKEKGEEKLEEVQETRGNSFLSPNFTMKRNKLTDILKGNYIQ